MNAYLFFPAFKKVCPQINKSSKYCGAFDQNANKFSAFTYVANSFSQKNVFSAVKPLYAAIFF